MSHTKLGTKMPVYTMMCYTLHPKAMLPFVCYALLSASALCKYLIVLKSHCAECTAERGRM